ncbi:hypothetical protein [Paenibacillus gansuensis]|uniref:DUF695 domain-containing protein n=1 Tax=Paenibacillus gansuensis TaxID=306542 RepID=A0ABW5PKA0_9BACL
MNIPAQLDGAKVIMFIENDANRPITKMLYEEEDGSSNEVLITGLALAKYENANEYYLFLCDTNWEVHQDFDMESIDEAINCSITTFHLNKNDWKLL